MTSHAFLILLYIFFSSFLLLLFLFFFNETRPGTSAGELRCPPFYFTPRDSNARIFVVYETSFLVTRYPREEFGEKFLKGRGPKQIELISRILKTQRVLADSGNSRAGITIFRFAIGSNYSHVRMTLALRFYAMAHFTLHLISTINYRNWTNSRKAKDDMNAYCGIKPH